MRFPAALLLSLFVSCLDGMLECAAEESETSPKQFLADRKEKDQLRQWVIPIPLLADYKFGQTTAIAKDIEFNRTR